MRRIIEENLANSTVHGVYDIYKSSDNFLRSFLIVCFLASIVSCCFLTTTTFVTYFSYNVLTTASLISDIPAECKSNLNKNIHVVFIEKIL